MEKQIEKKNYYNALYGYYYSLLTPKQQEIFLGLISNISKYKEED